MTRDEKRALAEGLIEEMEREHPSFVHRPLDEVMAFLQAKAEDLRALETLDARESGQLLLYDAQLFAHVRRSYADNVPLDATMEALRLKRRLGHRQQERWRFTTAGTRVA